MTTQRLAEMLVALDAPADLRAWASCYPDLARAWPMCPRGDWAAWLAARVGVDRAVVTTAAGRVVRAVVFHFPATVRWPAAGPAPVNDRSRRRGMLATFADVVTTAIAGDAVQAAWTALAEGATDAV